MKNFFLNLWSKPLRAAMGMERSTYNSVTALIGAWLMTDTFSHFIGLVLLMESLHVTIEGCWPAIMRAREGLDD